MSSKKIRKQSVRQPLLRCTLCNGLLELTCKWVAVNEYQYNKPSKAIKRKRFQKRCIRCKHEFIDVDCVKRNMVTKRDGLLREFKYAKREGLIKESTKFYYQDEGSSDLKKARK